MYRCILLRVHYEAVMNNLNTGILGKDRSLKQSTFQCLLVEDLPKEARMISKKVEEREKELTI